MPDWYLGASPAGGTKREVVRMFENTSPRRGLQLRWVVEYPKKGCKKASSSFAYRHDAEEFYRDLTGRHGGLSRSHSSPDPAPVTFSLPDCDWRL
jgi:hypothetical protein